MWKASRVVVEAAVPVLITVGMSLAANLVTDGRSLWWTLVLIALTSSAVAVDVVERLRKRREQNPATPVIPRSLGNFTGKHIVLCVAIVSLLGSFALVISRLISGDPSCRVEEFRNYQELPYNCDIAWSRLDPPVVPIYRWPQPSPTTLDVLDVRKSREEQFFACQITADLSDGYGLSNGTHHWALAPGDGPDHLWGWVPQVFFEHGADGSKEENLPECDDAQKAKPGNKFIA